MSRVLLPEPRETVEQQKLIQLVRLHERIYPCLTMLFAVPNGARTSPAQAGKLKAEGLRAGVPDLCLPVPRAGYFGWFGELKRERSGYLSPEQSTYLEQLRMLGYRAGWYRGADEMWDDLEWYCKQEYDIDHLIDMKMRRVDSPHSQRPLKPTEKTEVSA